MKFCRRLEKITIDDHGLKRGFFLEMDSACRNQQDNCDEVENSARPFLVFFSIVVEFMQ